MAAMGAMVPDWHLRQTVPKMVRSVCTVSTDASGNATIFFAPHPALTTLFNVGSTFSGLVSYAGVTSAYYAFNNAECSGYWTAFRPVAMGLRLRSSLPALTSQGKVIVAPFVMGGMIPSNSFLATAAATNLTSILDSMIGGVSFSTTSQIWQVPGARTYSVQELVEDEVIVCGRPGGPAAFTFRNCQSSPSYGATQHRYMDLEIDSGGPTTYNGNASFQSVQDLQGFLISIQGAPASSAVLEIDYILHLEVQENPTTTAGVPFTTAPVNGRSDPTAYLKDLSWADKFDSIARSTGNALGSAMRFVQTAVGGAAAGYYGGRHLLTDY